MEEDIPGRKGGKRVREVRRPRDTPCRTHLLSCVTAQDMFMFRVCKHNSRLVTCILGSAVLSPGCDLQGHGRTGTVTQQAMTWHHFLLLLLARMWSSCLNPTAKKKAKECTPSCAKEGERPVSYFLYSTAAHPNPTHLILYSLCLHFFFPVALLLHALRVGNRQEGQGSPKC